MGLPGPSSMKSTPAIFRMTDVASRISNLSLPTLPTTCSGGIL
jgi:hypothetical protein